MFCHNCGTKLEEGSAFCPECGAKQLDGPQPENAPEDALNEQPSGGAYEPEEPVKDSRRFLLILILIIVLGIALGIGGFFLYQKKSAPASKEAETTAEKDTKKNTAKKQEPKEEKQAKEQTASPEPEEKEETPAEKTYTHEYTFIQEMRTWEDAKTYCEAQGGHLATVTSQEEYDKITALANSSGCLVVWIGGMRLSDNSFGWVNGEDFTYSAWAAGEPNNDGGTEHYIGIMKVNGSWGMYDMPNDVSPYYSSSKVGFIMEKDIEQ